MKKVVLITLITTLLSGISSCGDKKDQEVTEYLLKIENLYSVGEYELALSKIDSIQTLYPKAFDQIKAGLALKQEVRKALNQKQIEICDSLLTINSVRIDSLKGFFTYQKDKDDDKGTFIHKSVLSNVIATTMLRSGVNENGTLYIESLYLGGQRHNRVGVISKDKQTAESLPVNDDGLNYKFSNMGQQYEVIRIIPVHDNGLAQFISNNTDKPLTVQLKGKSTISYALSSTQKKAITDSFHLSSMIEERDSLLLAKDKAMALIGYLNSKSGVEE